MMTLSKKMYYVVEAVLYIAYNAGAKPISSKEIAERQNLPGRYLEQVMQKLVRSGILRGVRGPHGGYLLARERRRISVAEICEVLADDDDDKLSTWESTPLGDTVVRPLWHQMHGVVMEQLAEVTVADLCERATQNNIRKTAEERMDFTI